MTEFRDMKEQGTFHAGRKYERDILSKRIEELEAVIAKHREHNKKCMIYRFSALGCQCGLEEDLIWTCDYLNENDKLKERIEELEATLTRIDTWAKAYPLKAFPEPDLVEVHEVLKAHGLSLDEVSASNMRHVLDGVKDIVGQALKPRT